jgi:hypothetical protein
MTITKIIPHKVSSQLATASGRAEGGESREGAGAADMARHMVACEASGKFAQGPCGLGPKAAFSGSKKGAEEIL